MFYFPCAGHTFPGMVMDICPPQLHMHLALLISAGKFAIFTCPGGAQGAITTGMQGIGVSTPNAAEVAEATVGLANDWHIPNGIMLTIGLLSMMFAMGLFCMSGRVGSTTINVDGAIPNVHCIIAPAQTNCPMINSPSEHPPL